MGEQGGGGGGWGGEEGGRRGPGVGGTKVDANAAFSEQSKHPGRGGDKQKVILLTFGDALSCGVAAAGDAARMRRKRG